MGAQASPPAPPVWRALPGQLFSPSTVVAGDPLATSRPSSPRSSAFTAPTGAPRFPGPSKNLQSAFRGTSTSTRPTGIDGARAIRPEPFAPPREYLLGVRISVLSPLCGVLREPTQLD